MDREQRIIEYLQRTLSAEARQDFENELAESPELTAELESYRTAFEVTKAYGRMQLKDQLGVHESTKYDRPRRSIRRRALWAAAASIALLAIAYFILDSAPPTPDALYAEYFEPYRDPVFQRGTTNASLQQAAFAAYSAGDHRLSAATFDQMTAMSDVDRFYQGMNYLILERPALAISHLTVVAQQSGSYRSQATWYLALAYIKMDDRENARVLLQQVVASGDFNLEEAGEVLEAIE